MDQHGPNNPEGELHAKTTVKRLCLPRNCGLRSTVTLSTSPPPIAMAASRAAPTSSDCLV